MIYIGEGFPCPSSSSLFQLGLGLGLGSEGDVALTVRPYHANISWQVEMKGITSRSATSNE